MLNTALKLEGPVAIRYPRSVGLGVELTEELKELPVGKAEVLREGKDLTLIGIGPMVNTCIAAAQELHHRGVEATVINLRFLNPLDRETILRYARMTKHIITVEDHMLAGGMGSSVLETLADAEITDVAVERIGYEEYVDQGAISLLHQAYGLSVKGILNAVERLKVLQRIEGRNRV
jgi:1-deoxy-D-xylulose-5-phosphate synthase